MRKLYKFYDRTWPQRRALRIAEIKLRGLIEPNPNRFVIAFLIVFFGFAIAFALGGCVPQERTVWLQTNGQPAHGQQFELARTVCLGEAQKATLSSGVDRAQYCPGSLGDAAICAFEQGQAQKQVELRAIDVGKACMAQRGYIATQVRS